MIQVLWRGLAWLGGEWTTRLSEWRRWYRCCGEVWPGWEGSGPQDLVSGGGDTGVVAKATQQTTDHWCLGGGGGALPWDHWCLGEGGLPWSAGRKKTVITTNVATKLSHIFCVLSKPNKTGYSSNSTYVDMRLGPCRCPRCSPECMHSWSHWWCLSCHTLRYSGTG